MKSATFDIETTHLGACGAGKILCVCIRAMDTQRTSTFRIDSYEFEPSDDFGWLEREETQLLRDVLGELGKYQILIGHNINKFDIPYIRSRAFQCGIDCNMRPGVYDTLLAFRRTGYLTYPNGFGKPSGGLDSVADFLNIRQEKTKIMPHEWWTSIWGKKTVRADAMNNIVSHCQKDVRMNARIFPLLWEADQKGRITK